ncbi:MAG TPA: HDOD domain-containing protein [Verrucomicrobiae bacterium]|nr:HDOD domain-containing protein [Verrucomicrobiae bacterium]
MGALASASPVCRLQRAQIEARLKVCNPLPSLTCTNHSLNNLLAVENRYTNQICEVIRKDPSLCSRILHLVNCAYFGLATPVRQIEQAVFYLGLEQIRRLALITPVIEDLKHLVDGSPFTWPEFWQHSIGTAIMTREVMEAAGQAAEETEYLAGLLHDVGKIVMASVFPDHFTDVQHCLRGVLQDLGEVETYVLGMDHSELGALYLKSHNVPEVFVETARFHHAPLESQSSQTVVSAVQVADLLIRHAQIGSSGNPNAVTREHLFASAGWKILFGSKSPKQEIALADGFDLLLTELPAMLNSMV